MIVEYSRRSFEGFGYSNTQEWIIVLLCCSIKIDWMRKDKKKTEIKLKKQHF